MSGWSSDEEESSGSGHSGFGYHFNRLLDSSDKLFTRTDINTIVYKAFQICEEGREMNRALTPTQFAYLFGLVCQSHESEKK